MAVHGRVIFRPSTGGRALRARMIDWDGTHLPEELRQLPPGRYFLESVDDILVLDELTPEEDAGIRLALDQVEAGQVVPLDEVMRKIRSRARRR
jgi:hypothetical protein